MSKTVAVAVMPAANLAPPEALTMDRLGDVNEMIVAQSTSQCCRRGACQTSINWVLSESNNFAPGSNPFDMPIGGWIHEESSFLGRCCFPLCRAQRYTQHAGVIPNSILAENGQWCVPQFGEFTMGMTDEERNRDVVAYHEKGFSLPMNNCCFHPYLETKNANGELIGKTQFACDMCLAIPKFDVYDGNGQKMYHLRPDTCCLGCCILPRCGGTGGKCFRVPFIIRDPVYRLPLQTPAHIPESTPQVTMLWAGFKNEFCSQKNAYHVAFPEDMTEEMKTVLLGSALLIDVQMNEQKKNNNDN